MQKWLMGVPFRPFQENPKIFYTFPGLVVRLPLRQISVQERHNLSPCADFAGSKGAVSLARGDAVLNRSRYGFRLLRAACHIREVDKTACRGLLRQLLQIFHSYRYELNFYI